MAKARKKAMRSVIRKSEIEVNTQEPPNPTRSNSSVATAIRGSQISYQVSWSSRPGSVMGWPPPMG